MMGSMDANPEAAIRALDARARRLETPCGEGTLVWRGWGETGPPLVFFHGAAGSWTHWIKQIEDFSTDHRVWIPDLPGNGDSAQTIPPNDLDAAATAVVQGLDSILPREAFCAVAFSAGLLLCAETAGRIGRIDLIVAVSPGAVGPISPLGLRSLRGITDEGERDAVHRHNLMTLMLADPNKADELALLIQKENSRRARFSLRYIDQGAPALVSLEKARTPIAVIWGDSDAARPDIDHYRQLFYELQPDLSFHVIEGAGHWLMYEAPGRCNEIIRALLVSR